MILKLAAISVVLGVCFALTVDDPEVVEVTPTYGLVPSEPKPDQDLPRPPNPDDSDLKPEASAWWYPRRRYHEVPVYYYRTPVRYTYWKTFY